MADIKKQQELANELSSKLWAMANDLRGNMEAYEFKNYILGLLFYKELSDRTEKFVAKLLEEDEIEFKEAWEDEEYKVDDRIIKPVPIPIPDFDGYWNYSGGGDRKSVV